MRDRNEHKNADGTLPVRVKYGNVSCSLVSVSHKNKQKRTEEERNNLRSVSTKTLSSFNSGNFVCLLMVVVV